MLEQVREEDVEIGVEAADWEEAIRKCADPLLQRGKIEAGYIDAMIEAVHRIGPYIVLGNHVALAHARPECGVKELAVCFSTLNPPVAFGSPGFDPVRLVITLAATDANSHLDLMSELAGVLMEEENVERLADSRSPREFLELLMDMSDEA